MDNRDNRVYGYARVSTKEQNLDRQLDALAGQGIAERDIITDKESGKDLERKGYRLLKDGLLRRGDTLVVKSLDRLSRSKEDIKQELEFFKANGIRLKVIDLPTTMADFPEGQEWVQDMINNILIEHHGRAGAADHPAASGRGHCRRQEPGRVPGQAPGAEARELGRRDRPVACREDHRDGGDQADRDEAHDFL